MDYADGKKCNINLHLRGRPCANGQGSQSKETENRRVSCVEFIHVNAACSKTLSRKENPSS